MITSRMILICAVGLASVSCSSNEKLEANENASGIYVREYSHEVTNLNSGNRIGYRKVRDTIFIEKTDKAYLVTNRKWRLNDFDNEGWMSMEHSDSKPLPTFQASFDENTKSFIADNELLSYPLYLDSDKQKLYKGKSRETEYVKIK